ncbi:homocysteine S-methyltransferase [Halobacillus massiliensis]|uniref:homocysteine S-methyltransferase n=1 Tax=Halobacillus massiliensis TaxID=1926286 RepID=UPI0009E37A10|nr:homocysteine S-methyltransferase [Halobacillus massiliensis]
MPKHTNQKFNPIDSILKKFSPIILDGALATELEKQGFDLDDPLWSARVLMENPDAIAKIHADYFRKGADVAITSSYQATIEGFAQRGIRKEKAIELIKKTVLLARGARDEVWKEIKKTNRPKPLVAASVGPYGAYLADGSEYKGNYKISDVELKKFHRPRLEALIEAGADLLALETIPSLQEAKVLISLLEEFPETSAWLSFTLKDGKSISDGASLQECASAVHNRQQVAAIGVNCAPISDASAAVEEFYKYTNKPIIVYPNSGERYNPETKTWCGSTDGSFETQSEVWFKNGARIIGGCCRTSPEHIESLYRKWRG